LVSAASDVEAPIATPLKDAFKNNLRSMLTFFSSVNRG
jgi:hypothetical protein